MTLLNFELGDVVGIPAEKEGVWGFVLSLAIRKEPSKWIEVFGNFYDNFCITEDEILKN